MKYILLIFFITTSCINHSSDKNINNEKAWVYIELLYVTKNDTTADYLYGKIIKSDIEKIKSKKNADGLFEITDGRYIDKNDNDIIHDFAEGNQTGTFLYRYKDVVYLELLKNDPLIAQSDTITE